MFNKGFFFNLELDKKHTTDKTNEHLFESFKEVTYKKNDVLYIEGDVCRELIRVKSGKVKVCFFDTNGDEHILAYKGAGTMLGQMTLLENQHYQNFAIIAEDGTRVSKICIEKAKELIKENPVFEFEINRHINKHMANLQRRIEILFHKNIKTRLYEFLKDLAKDHGKNHAGGVFIPHSLTQGDIANSIGTSRKTASLLLNEFEQEGLLTFDRKHIYIPYSQNLVSR